MEIYNDIGFDLVPKYPLPAEIKMEAPKAETLQVLKPEASFAPLNTPDLKSQRTDNNFFRWFLFGLFVLGTIRATVYMAKRDSRYSGKIEE